MMDGEKIIRKLKISKTGNNEMESQIRSQRPFHKLHQNNVTHSSGRDSKIPIEVAGFKPTDQNRSNIKIIQADEHPENIPTNKNCKPTRVRSDTEKYMNKKKSKSQ